MVSFVSADYDESCWGDVFLKTQHLRPTVVGVDDDFRVREAIMSLVKSAGYECLVFSSAQEFLDSGALEYARCLITDVRMPEIDGIELQRLARLVRTDLPVIFISAHREPAIKEQAFFGGAVGFLWKPFDVTALLDLIDHILSVPTDG